MVAGLLLVAAMPLYLVRGTPPRLEDAAAFTAYVTDNNRNFLTGVLVDTLYIAAFLVFLAGLSHRIRQARSGYGWLSMLIFGAGLVGAAVTLLGDTLIAGAALDTSSRAAPTVVRALTEAALPAFGAIGLIMVALFLLASGYAIVATSALPRWTGWLACAVALLHLAAAPSIYGGNDFLEATIAGRAADRGVYSYATSVAGLAYLIWLFSAAISMMAARHAEDLPARPAARLPLARR